jgi:scyllo-inositol 2-dehydrogenase (NADP+)
MIRVGLIGFGLGGRVFHAPLLSSVEGMELDAVLERAGNKAAERYPGIATYRTLEELLGDASLTLIVVTTPNGTHFELARQALRAGKSVVVDKPMAVTSAEIAELIALAREKNLLLAPFHNRRWDGDFLTVEKLLHAEAVGRLVAFESHMNRWRPTLPTERVWKNDPAAGGGLLLDLGTHLADQALKLFGKPEAVSAEVMREREGTRANDAFTLRLRYAGFVATLGANSLSLPAAPRFHLRGTQGNYWKDGVDPQEAALAKIARIEEPARGDSAWGREPAAAWGRLHVGIDGGTVSRPVEAVAGDYRVFYAGIRDALLGKGPTPVSAIDAWRVARILEWAALSSDERREIACAWSGEPGED